MAKWVAHPPVLRVAAFHPFGSALEFMVGASSIALRILNMEGDLFPSGIKVGAGERHPPLFEMRFLAVCAEIFRRYEISGLLRLRRGNHRGRLDNGKTALRIAPGDGAVNSTPTGRETDR